MGSSEVEIQFVKVSQPKESNNSKSNLGIRLEMNDIKSYLFYKIIGILRKSCNSAKAKHYSSHNYRAKKRNITPEM